MGKRFFVQITVNVRNPNIQFGKLNKKWFGFQHVTISDIRFVKFKKLDHFIYKKFPLWSSLVDRPKTKSLVWFPSVNRMSEIWTVWEWVTLESAEIRTFGFQTFTVLWARSDYQTYVHLIAHYLTDPNQLMITVGWKEKNGSINRVLPDNRYMVNLQRYPKTRLVR